MSLDRYQSKRRFDKTPEPAPSENPATAAGNRFYIQRHSARRLHYDLRLEVDSVLKSWALPKGPTLDPAEKRLAVHVEDHPMDYGTFEGTIPQGNYGAGTVSVWDYGTYEVLGDAPIQKQLDRGDFKFRLHGQRLAGEFALVRTKKSPKEWLLIKKKDFAVIVGWDPEADTRSVLAGRVNVESIVGAVRAELPDSRSPMLATLATSLPKGPDWVFEPKWDGVRAICVVRDGKVSLVSRTGRKMDVQYPELGELPQNISADTAVLDGEIVALDENGRPSFPLLQSRISASADESVKQARVQPVSLFAFDLLYLDGYDLRKATLLDRKAALKAVLRPSQLIEYSEHFSGNGDELLNAAKENQLEGVIAKRGGSSYESRRTADWIKVKVLNRQEFVICGFTKGEREPFGALVLGCWSDGRLEYAGNVGTGFSNQALNSIHDLLRPEIAKHCPFPEVPQVPEQVVWVTPKIVCSVRFMSWPKNGRLRAPSFVGLEQDKDADDCGCEREVPQAVPATVSPDLLTDKKVEQSVLLDGRQLKFGNLNKVFYPEHGYNKRDLINYYHAVSPLILPHLKDRPLSLKRYPNGIAADYFFQKNAAAGTPDWIRSELIDSEHRGEPIRFLFAEDEASLLYLTNLGCIDQNPWMSRYGSLDSPDFMLIDLDPVACTFDRIVEAALLVRKVLDRLELKGFPKTTGGDGLHIYVPLEPGYSYEQVRSFAEIVARLTFAERPELFTTPRTVSQREKGKVYFDYLQISKGKTIAAPYVLRAFPGAPVSTPLRWSELTRDLTPDRFTIANVRDRFSRLGDIFAPVLSLHQKMEEALARLDREVKAREKKK
jgi:bifunctional non-homologous end joining protein LigD